MPVTQHSDITREKMRQRALEREAIKRGEIIPLKPITEPLDLNALLEKIPWANLQYRVEHLSNVAEKLYQDIISSDRVSPRHVEVLNQTADGIAKEVGGRQVKQAVELSGQVDSQQLQVHLYIPEIDADDDRDQTT